MIILKIPIPFSQLSCSLLDSLKRLPSTSKWMSAALPRSWLCTNLWMNHHESANLEWNLYRTCDPWQKSSIGKRTMYIHICGWRTFCFGARFVIRWHRWQFGPRWRRFRWWCTLAFAPPACLWILCGVILAMKEAVGLIVTNHCRVSCDRSLHHVMPGKLDTPLLLFSDFDARCLDWLSLLLHSGAWKPFFGHFGHMQGKTHVWLFKLYLTWLSCHSSWHVENLQESSCCIYSEIRVIPQPYMTPYSSRRSLQPDSPISGDVYHEIRLRKSQNWQHHHVQFRGLCGQMPL